MARETTRKAESRAHEEERRRADDFAGAMRERADREDAARRFDLDEQRRRDDAAGRTTRGPAPPGRRCPGGRSS